MVIMEKRGGKRQGAGRKPVPDKKKMVSFRLHPKLIERLKKEPNQALVIERALCEYLGVDLKRYTGQGEIRWN